MKKSVFSKKTVLCSLGVALLSKSLCISYSSQLHKNRYYKKRC
jgi:hypothetical protein